MVREEDIILHAPPGESLQRKVIMLLLTWRPGMSTDRIASALSCARKRALTILRELERDGYTSYSTSGWQANTSRWATAPSLEPQQGEMFHVEHADPMGAAVTAVCQAMVDSVASRSNGYQPRITSAWEREARGLLKDGVTPEQAIHVIQWAAAHHFWGAIIINPTKLRQHWAALTARMNTSNAPTTAQQLRQWAES